MAKAGRFDSLLAPNDGGAITVVFLHGLLRTSAVMKKLARRVGQATNWKTVCLDYPSRSLPLQGLAEGLVQEVRDAAGPQGRVFAVTHSMGAVVLRHIMGLENSGGIVWMGAILLAPPNQGSTVARILSQAWGIGPVFGFIYGRAGVELGLELAKNAAWPDPPRPCAIIAGTKSLGALAPVSWMTSALGMLSGENDGTVAVAETKLAAMSAFATVYATHAALINHPDTERLVLIFLEKGSF